MSNSNRESVSSGENYNHVFSNDEGYANSALSNENYGQHYEYVPFEDPMEVEIQAQLNREHVTLNSLKQLRKKFKRDSSRSNPAESLWVAQVPHRPGYEIRVYVPSGRKFEEEVLRMGGRIPPEVVKPGYVEYVSEEPGAYPIAVFRGVRPPAGYHIQKFEPVGRLPSFVSLTNYKPSLPTRAERNLEKKVKEQIRFFEEGRGNSLLTEEPRYKRPTVRRRKEKARELSDDEREEERRIEAERPVYTNFQTKEAENRYIASLSKKIVNEAIHGRRRSYSTRSRARSVPSKPVRSSRYDPFSKIPTRPGNLYVEVKNTLIPGYNKEQTKLIRNLFEEETQLKREEPKAYPGLKRYKGRMIKEKMKRRRTKKGPSAEEAGKLIRRQYRHEKEPEPRYEKEVSKYDELKEKTERIIKFIGGNPKSYKSLLQNPGRLIELLGSKDISHEQISDSWRVLREFLKLDLEKRRVSDRPLYDEYLKIGRELRPKKGKVETEKPRKRYQREAHKRIELKVKRVGKKLRPLYPVGGIPISLIKEAEDENESEKPKRNKSKMKRIHTNRGYISIGTKKCESYSKDELVKLCKEYGLPHVGTKPVLCQRLKDFHNS